jgi:hypothetical protein
MGKIAISELKLDPENVRAHNERNIEAIKRSLERFGQQKAQTRPGRRVYQARRRLALAWAPTCRSA